MRPGQVLRLGRALCLAAIVAFSAGCGPQGAPRSPSAGRPPGRAATHEAHRGDRPRVTLQVTPGLRTSASAISGAIASARRFALSLTAWLYGDRRRLRIEPLTADAARAVRREPPASIPLDQRGIGQGRAEIVELALQTATSGVVTVTVNDLRVDLRIPADIRYIGGQWLIAGFPQD